MKRLAFAVAALACAGLARLVLISVVVLASLAYLAICAGRALETLKEPQLADSPSDFGGLVRDKVAALATVRRGLSNP